MSTKLRLFVKEWGMAIFCTAIGTVFMGWAFNLFRDLTRESSTSSVATAWLVLALGIAAYVAALAFAWKNERRIEGERRVRETQEEQRERREAERERREVERHEEWKSRLPPPDRTY